jgi:hypothetical protein
MIHANQSGGTFQDKIGCKYLVKQLQTSYSFNYYKNNTMTNHDIANQKLTGEQKTSKAANSSQPIEISNKIFSI